MKFVVLNMIAVPVVLTLSMAFCLAQDQPKAKKSLKPVKVDSGSVALAPGNARIDFVGEHEGSKPDPRKGGFSKFTGSAKVADGGLKSVAFDIETPSMWTEIPKLTGHLKSPDFFDVRQHPKATFRSTSVKLKSGPTGKTSQYEVAGKFTLLGVSQDIKVPTTVTLGPDGMTLVSDFKLDRSRFGMNYGKGKVKNHVQIKVVVGQPTPKLKQ